MTKPRGGRRTSRRHGRKRQPVAKFKDRKSFQTRDFFSGLLDSGTVTPPLGRKARSPPGVSRTLADRDASEMTLAWFGAGSMDTPFALITSGLPPQTAAAGRHRGRKAAAVAGGREHAAKVSGGQSDADPVIRRADGKRSAHARGAPAVARSWLRPQGATDQTPGASGGQSFDSIARQGTSTRSGAWSGVSGRGVTALPSWCSDRREATAGACLSAWTRHWQPPGPRRGQRFRPRRPDLPCLRQS